MKMRRIVWIILIGSGLLLMSVLGFTGCDNDDDGGTITITSLTADPGKIVVNGTSQLTCMATHSKGYPLEYIWVATAGSISGSGHIVTWNAPDSRGEYTVICKVLDNAGKQATADVMIEVIPLIISPPHNHNCSAFAVNEQAVNVKRVPEQAIWGLVRLGMLGGDAVPVRSFLYKQT